MCLHLHGVVQVNLSELAKSLGYAEGVVPPGKVVESPESKAMRRMSMVDMQVSKIVAALAKLNLVCDVLWTFCHVPRHFKFT